MSERYWKLSSFLMVVTFAIWSLTDFELMILVIGLSASFLLPFPFVLVESRSQKWDNTSKHQLTELQAKLLSNSVYRVGVKPEIRVALRPRIDLNKNQD